MTHRELELWIEGREVFWARVRQHVAWAIAPLINIHVGKGRKVKINDLLPRDDVRRMRAAMKHTDVEQSEPTTKEEFVERMREREGLADNRKFWDGPDGAELAALLGIGDDGYEEDAGRTAADVIDAEFEVETPEDQTEHDMPEE